MTTRSLSVSLVALALVACGDASPAPAPNAGSRFEGVQSAQGDVDQVLRDTCDVVHPATSAPAYEPPPTTERPTRAAPGRWTWVNFWATWCHPCVEEMPMLEQRLAGSPIDLAFVSVDAPSADLAAFRSSHHLRSALPRIEEGATINPTLAAAGVRGASSLPMHLLVDPDGKVRCVRAGAVEGRHVDAILAALGQPAPAPRIR